MASTTVSTVKPAMVIMKLMGIADMIAASTNISFDVFDTGAKTGAGAGESE